MKIGLIRHFKVDCRWPFSADSNKLQQAVINYNEASCKIRGVPPDVSSYQQCYSSDMSRAGFTAREIWKGPIKYTPKLREVMMYPVFKSRLPIPIAFWKVAGRFAWAWNGKSQLEGRSYTQQRAREILDEVIASGQDTLLVTHGYFMMILQYELHKRGFKGDYFIFPFNGKLCEFYR